MINTASGKRRLAALLALFPLALSSCSGPAPEPADPAPPAAPADSEAPESAAPHFEGLDEKIAEIEAATNTQASFSLFDGSTPPTNSGSGGVLPAWSTIKVPIALTAWEHCDDKDFVVEQTTAAIEWSDNDAAYYLWRCLGSDAEASQLVGDEIAKAGVSVHVEPAFGMTNWPIPAQARYAQHLASVPADNPVIQEMHNIDAEHSYGLGTIADLPFKGGWSDADDGSFHVRQLGFFIAGDTNYGVAIAARSVGGSEQDCQDALDQIAALLAESSGELQLKTEQAEQAAQAGKGDQGDQGDQAEQTNGSHPEEAEDAEPQVGEEMPHMPKVKDEENEENQ